MTQLELAKEQNRKTLQKWKDNIELHRKEIENKRQQYLNNVSWVRHQKAIGAEFAEGEYERWMLSEKYDEPRPKLKSKMNK